MLRRIAASLSVTVLVAVAGPVLSAQSTQVDATLLPVIFDRQDGSHFTRWLALDASGRSFDLDTLSGGSASLGALPAGEPLRLTVASEGERRNVTRWQRRGATGTPQRPARLAAAMFNVFADVPFAGPLPVLVIPCAFSDASPSTTLEVMQRAMSGEFPGVGSFISAASSGRASLAGTRVLDWVTIPERIADWFVNSTPSYDPSRYSSTLARDEAFVARCLAEVRRREPTLTVQPFTAIQMMLPVNLGVSYAYLAPVPLNSVDPSRRIRLVMNSNWAAMSPGVQAHELGHTLGLLHTFGPYGVQYDSRWDVMSSASHGYDPVSQMRYGTLFNGWHRMRLGWGGDDPVASVPLSAMQDTVLLTPPSAGALARTARIELTPVGPGAARVMTLEARRRDAQFEGALPLEGVVVHRVTARTAIVVDRDGNGNPNDEGAVLRPGETWEDEVEGIAVAVLEELPGGFRVAVTRRNALRIIATATRRLQLGRPYEDSLGVLGGVAPVRLTAESLVPGVRLDTALQLLTGMPTQTGPYTMRLRATDATGVSTVHEIAAVVDPLELVAGPMVREGRVGEARVDTLAYYRNGPGFNGWIIFLTYAGHPPGMQLEFVRPSDSVTAAVIRGTPTQVIDKTYQYGVRSNTDERTWQLTFRFRPPRLIVAGDSLRPDQVEGINGADTLRLSGGSGAPYLATRWRVMDGQLPDGWVLDSVTGIVSGIARTVGTFNAAVHAFTPADTATATLQWTILSALELGESPWGPVLPLGVSRHDTLQVVSRAGAPQWQVLSGVLPVGITLTGDGRLTGAPTNVGPFEALLEVSAGEAARTLRLAGVVERVPLRAQWASTDTVVVQGDAVIDSLQVLDGDGSPVTLALAVDSLPPGLSFDPSRRSLTGRPISVGTWRVQVAIAQGEQRLVLTRVLAVTPLATLPEDTLLMATAGFEFTHEIAPVVRGGGTFTVREGGQSLPRGLSVAADGRLSGVPDTLGGGIMLLMLDVARAEGQYEVPLSVRWHVREAELDAGAVFDALLGGPALSVEPARGLDLLGNRNQRLDIGDVLRWLVRQGVLTPSATLQDVVPALQRLMPAPASAAPTPERLP